MKSEFPTRLLPSFAALGLPIALFSWLAYRLRWTCDDAFVDFRVVGHLLAGHGPVFNLGERVEAYSNALWVAVLAMASSTLGFQNIERVSVVTGILLTAGGLLFAMLASMKLFTVDGVATRLWLPFMCLTVVGIRAFQEYASSGLETGLSFFLLGLSVWTVFGPKRRHPSAAAFVLGLLPLNRPDFAVYWVVFGAYLIHHARRDGPLRLATLAATLIALPAAYQVFRMGYFASWVPNTALAKEASLPYWGQGVRYLADFLSTYRLQYLIPLYLVLAAWISLRFRARLLRHALIVCCVAAGLHAAYIVRVGGDFMHARMLLTDYFLLVAPLAVLPIPAGDRWWPTATFAVVLAWSGISLVWFRMPYQGMDFRYYIHDERSIWAGRLGGVDNPINAVDLSQPPPTPNAGRYHVAGNAGFEGFKLVKYGLHDVLFLEDCGLGDPITSRQLLEGRRTIGHEKCRDPRRDPWIAARFPDLESSTASPTDVALAREVFDGSVLGDYLGAITRPLTWSGFFRNVGNAYTFTRFRVVPIDWIREVPPLRRNASTFDRMMLQRARFNDLEARDLSPADG